MRPVRVAAALAAVALTVVAAPRASATTGWVVESGKPGPEGVGFKFGGCRLSHSERSDPIVHPGVPGAGHLHDFFANPTTTYNSTVAAMRAAKPIDTCGPVVTDDTAGYWTPAVYDGHGDKVGIRHLTVYYVNGNKPSAAIRDMPADLRMIAGNPMATGPQPTDVVWWSCSDNKDPGGRAHKGQRPPAGCAGKARFVTVHVQFPDCWDGTLHAHTGPGNTADFADKPGAVHNHLARTHQPGCPDAPFIVALPFFELRIEYDTSDANLFTACEPGMGGCDAAGSNGSIYAMHADAWFTWNPADLHANDERCNRASPPVQCHD